ncbi:MAG: hypothetical protein ABI843_09135 [Dokdonella sp.]
MNSRLRVAALLVLSVVFDRSAFASDALLDLADHSIFPDSPHRLSGEHNVAAALTKASVLDPNKTGAGAADEKTEFARTMEQLAAGYMQLGADALAAQALRTGSNFSKQYLFDYAEALYLAGQTEEAMTIFAEASAAAPTDTSGAVTAGFYLLMENQADQAIARLRPVAQGDGAVGDRGYAVLYLILAARMQRADSKHAIADIAMPANINWPFELRDVLISGPSRNIDSTLMSSQPAFQDRLCEALFYVGYSHEIDGNRDKAQRFYRAALDTHAQGIRAYAAARIRLTDLLAGHRRTKTVTPRNLSSVEARLQKHRG